MLCRAASYPFAAAAGVLAGEIALPAGAVREPFVDADDLPDVVVAALTKTVTPTAFMK